MKKLGRRLQSEELVHHKGKRYEGIENKQDNLEDNLEMTTRPAHFEIHGIGLLCNHKKQPRCFRGRYLKGG